MIKSCVTISLVEEARGGPFVFWDGLADGCRQAKELGFDAVEVFPPSPEAVSTGELAGLLDEHSLELGAVGTGAGWVRQRLQLCSADSGERERAQAYIRSIIDVAGALKAPAIIGSMQGRWSEEVDQDTAIGYLSEALNLLGQHARQYGVPLLYEPLNRYETNLITTIESGVELLKSLSTHNVKLLADLFHMHIEESDMAAAIRSGKGYIGHVHFVDSNRQAAGRGHMDFGPVAAALEEIGFDGYASAEAFAIPDSHETARQTIETFKKYFG